MTLLCEMLRELTLVGNEISDEQVDEICNIIYNTKEYFWLAEGALV